MDENKKSNKMSIEEYKDKYCKPENTKLIKSIIFLAEAGIGIVIFACLLLIALRIYDMNEYAGYGAGVACLLAFVLLYIIPVARIRSQKSFITNVNGLTARKAQKYNKKLREDLADKFIDIQAKADCATYYSDEKIGKLAIARHQNDDKALKSALSELYKTDIKKASNKLIKDTSLKVGLITALSPSPKVDTFVIVAFEIDLIKNIVFQYGFRPSDAKMAKLYERVLASALVAYGLQNASASIGKGVVSALTKGSSSIPFIGGILGAVIGSATQGLTNSLLTTLIGMKTRQYLMKEYHLQDVLDEIEITDEEEAKEQAEILADVKQELEKNTSKKKKEEALA